jgi:predicted Ser/Thr protein kinase
MALKLGISKDAANYVARNMKQHQMSGHVIIYEKNFISVRYDYLEGTELAAVEKIQNAEEIRKKQQQQIIQKKRTSTIT